MHQTTHKILCFHNLLSEQLCPTLSHELLPAREVRRVSSFLSFALRYLTNALPRSLAASTLYKVARFSASQCTGASFFWDAEFFRKLSNAVQLTQKAPKVYRNAHTGRRVRPHNRNADNFQKRSDLPKTARTRRNKAAQILLPLCSRFYLNLKKYLA